MTISILQHVFADDGGVAGATLTVTLTNVQAGSTICVFGTDDDAMATLSSVSDPTNGTYGNGVGSGKFVNFDDVARSQRYWGIEKENVAHTAGNLVITGTWAAATAVFKGLCAVEIAGLPTANALDGSKAGTDVAPGAGTDAITIGSPQPYNKLAPALIVSVVVDVNGTNPPVLGTGFTSNGTGVFGGSQTLLTSRRILGGAPPVTATAGAGDSAKTFDLVIAIYDETGAQPLALPGPLTKVKPTFPLVLLGTGILQALPSTGLEEQGGLTAPSSVPLDPSPQVGWSGEDFVQTAAATVGLEESATPATPVDFQDLGQIAFSGEEFVSLPLEEPAGLQPIPVALDPPPAPIPSEDFPGAPTGLEESGVAAVAASIDPSTTIASVGEDFAGSLPLEEVAAAQLLQIDQPPPPAFNVGEDLVAAVGIEEQSTPASPVDFLPTTFSNIGEELTAAVGIEEPPGLQTASADLPFTPAANIGEETVAAVEEPPGPAPTFTDFAPPPFFAFGEELPTPPAATMVEEPSSFQIVVQDDPPPRLFAFGEDFISLPLEEAATPSLASPLLDALQQSVAEELPQAAVVTPMVDEPPFFVAWPAPLPDSMPIQSVGEELPGPVIPPPPPPPPPPPAPLPPFGPGSGGGGGGGGRRGGVWVRPTMDQRLMEQRFAEMFRHRPPSPIQVWRHKDEEEEIEEEDEIPLIIRSEPAPRPRLIERVVEQVVVGGDDVVAKIAEKAAEAAAGSEKIVKVEGNLSLRLPASFWWLAAAAAAAIVVVTALIMRQPQPPPRRRRRRRRKRR